MNRVLELDRVSHSYGDQPVLEEVSLTVRRGEFLGLVGPNGGGKSTLLRVALGLERPLSGRVRVLGTTPEEARPRVGYCPQRGSFARDFPIEVLDVVLSGRLRPGRLLGRYGPRDRAVARAQLDAVGMGPLAGERIGALSGGQVQRVLIARALACEPELLLLDEPTANVDPDGERELFALFRDLSRRAAVVVVSHDVGFISGYVTRVVYLNRRLEERVVTPVADRAAERAYGSGVQAIGGSVEDA